MRVIPLRHNPKGYTANAYLVLGDWNALQDVNTLVDVGTDGYVLDEIATASTGVGKRPVERVILTHSHFDHRGGLAKVVEKYTPEVLALTPGEGVTRVLKGNEIVKMGDKECYILPCPVHSADSLLILETDQGILFSGDTPIMARGSAGEYPEIFLQILERLSRSGIKTIYPGHGKPLDENVQGCLDYSLSILKREKK